MNIRFFPLVALLSWVAVQDVDAASTAVMCYECITRHASWAIEPCTGAPKACTLGTFCYKATFGGSMTIRGCAPGGTEKDFNKEGKLCKKVKTHMESKNHVSPAIKKSFNDLVKVFEASCPKSTIDKINPLKHKEPKKGYTCHKRGSAKKACNGVDRMSGQANVFVAAAVVLASRYFGVRL